MESSVPAEAALNSVDQVGSKATYQVCGVTHSPRETPSFSIHITYSIRESQV